MIDIYITIKNLLIHESESTRSLSDDRHAQHTVPQFLIASLHWQLHTTKTVLKKTKKELAYILKLAIRES